MGWKGVVRSVVAASRAAAREQDRRNRQYQKHVTALAKQQAIEDATSAVREYDEYVSAIQSLHKTSSERIDWLGKSKLVPPPPPPEERRHERAAQAELSAFRASFLDRTFKRVEKKKSRLAENIQRSALLDQAEYEQAKKSHSELIEEIASERELACLLLDGDADASIDVIRQADVFSSVESLGSSAEFSFVSPRVLQVNLRIHGKDIVPKESMSLLKSGKISIKDMPKSNFNKIFQDHVCSASIRVARDAFALLPLKAVIVNAMDEVLNTSTGHFEVRPILSVYFPEEAMYRLHFDRIDPSDAVSGFLHHMEFKPGTGFKPVTAINPPETDAG